MICPQYPFSDRQRSPKAGLRLSVSALQTVEDRQAVDAGSDGEVIRSLCHRRQILRSHKERLRLSIAAAID